MKGKVKDTETAHRIRTPKGDLGRYTPQRKALHQEILTKLFQGKGTHEGSARAVFTAGGPASGKSKLVEDGLVTYPSDAVHVNPDLIREMLPEYAALTGAGRRDAAQLTHEEASHIAKLATNIALARGHHLVVDTVGDSEPGKFARKIMRAHAAGHQVSVHYATTSTAEALRRAEVRFLKKKRAVDEKVLRGAHKSVSQRFVTDVAKLPVHLQVFDTTTSPSRLIAERRNPDDKIRIIDMKAMKAFIAKARE